MFQEPPRSQGDINFRLLGLPVRINPWFWLMAIFLGLNRTPLGTAIWVAAVLVSIMVHELGHAAVLRMMGFHPWIVLHGFGGLTIHSPGEGWVRPPTRLGQVMISLAGPAAGFALAAVVVIGLKAAGYGAGIFWYGLGRFELVPGVMILEHLKLSLFTCDVLQVCVLWGVFNLLPIYPLDGGQIALQVLSAANPRQGMRQALIISVLTAGTLAAVALLQWHDFYTGLLFGYLAYSSYAMLQR
jgi:stage IV sporulation protein FB